MPWALKTPVRFSAGRNRGAAVGSKSDSPKFPAPCGCCATIGAAAIAFARIKKGGAARGRPPIPARVRAREYGARREDKGQPFCFRRAFYSEMARRNAFPSARKTRMPAVSAETRGSRARAIMASLKLDFPIKDAQVFGRYIRRAICGQVKGGKPPYLNK